MISAVCGRSAAARVIITCLGTQRRVGEMVVRSSSWGIVIAMYNNDSARYVPLFHCSATAVTAPQNDRCMFDVMTTPQVKVLRSVDNLSLADLVLKPTAIDGTEPADATDNALTVKGSSVDIGFWACSPGSFKTARDGVNEVILVLEGRGTLVSDTGERVDHMAGDMVLIPNGWSGVWEIHEDFKKQYISIAV
ncbi:DUF861 domain-containing protein [Arthrobacter sp. JZ12]|nr:DUF861 domain-containing protein [Arthrobacter sp. JZ12]